MYMNYYGGYGGLGGFYFDPTYILVIIGAVITMIASSKVNSTYNKYSRVRSIYGMTVQEAFAAFWIALLIFNLIKTVAIGVLTLLLYKRLSNFLKKIKI